MANNQCPECGRELPKRHTRCLFCDELKYKTELENPPIEPVTDAGFSNRLSELAENTKNQKEAEKQAKLDAALAWGTAIGETEMQETTSRQSNSDSYCSSCGYKFATTSNFCPGCGKKRNGLTSANSIGFTNISHKNKKSKSSVWAIIFLLLAVSGIGYGLYVNFSNKISSSEIPQDYETSSDSNYDGMAEACDHVSIAISHHDPRYLTSRDSQSDIEIYKSEMQLAADIFRDESNYNPNAFELTRIAQQMHDGYRGIDEYGRFPLMEFCGV
jgi:predicted RNA-binding Zn-ribbon protein involved in translation (DUF1610 family)